MSLSHDKGHFLATFNYFLSFKGLTVVELTFLEGRVPQACQGICDA